MKTFNFSKALKLMNDGKWVKRTSWNNGKCIKICLFNEKHRNFIAIREDQWGFYCWSPTNEDILADDWTRLD